MSTRIERVAVIGAGTMGSGIAQVFAQAGYSVQMIDISREQLASGLDSIQRATMRLAQKGRLSPDEQRAIIERIKTASALEAANEAQLVVEAVIEEEKVKEQVLASIAEGAPPETILASNTSSISITRLAAATRHPDRVIGMHFMNPAPVMKLVEVIRGLFTSDETLAAVVEIVRGLGKTPVTVEDSPGFVLNRLLIPMINEAAYLLMEGAASREDLDTVMVLGANHPMGPLALADLIGLDTCLAIMEVLHREFGEDKYRPCPLLRKMVSSGNLGRKTGRGFHSYD